MPASFRPRPTRPSCCGSTLLRLDAHVTVTSNAWWLASVAGSAPAGMWKSLDRGEDPTDQKES